MRPIRIIVVLTVLTLFFNGLYIFNKYTTGKLIAEQNKFIEQQTGYIGVLEQELTKCLEYKP